MGQKYRNTWAHKLRQKEGGDELAFDNIPDLCTERLGYLGDINAGHGVSFLVDPCSKKSPYSAPTPSTWQVPSGSSLQVTSKVSEAQPEALGPEALSLKKFTGNTGTSNLYSTKKTKHDFSASRLSSVCGKEKISLSDSELESEVVFFKLFEKFGE